MQTSLRAWTVQALIGGLLLVGCEKSIKQTFTPREGGDPAGQNGYLPTAPFRQPGQATYQGGQSGDDSVGRARFCNEEESRLLVQEMVRKPIIPDVSVGGVPMWTADGRPLLADDLVGRPEDGKFCDPTGIYSNAFTWGPTDEVIVFFNEETRLVEGVVAYTQYLGALEGQYTDGGGNKVPVVARPRERLLIDGVELDQYSSRADQANRTNSWMNNRNVTKFYKMVRETFFNAPPYPDDFDCVAQKACDLIYTAGNESIPQDTFIVLRDSALQIRFTPEGYAQFVYVEPVRVAPFEAQADVRFGADLASPFAFNFQSTPRPNCALNLEEQLTYGDFKSRCIDNGDNRTLQRANYDTYLARDAVDAQFSGVTLTWTRRTSEAPVFKDGEAPRDGDRLFGISFSRSLAAPVAEFRPRTLANLYATKLEARLQAAVLRDAPNVPRTQHPLYRYNITNPFILDNPQRIGELEVELTGEPINWITALVDDIIATVDGLSPELRAVVDPQVLEPVFLVEPFVDAVLETFAHGEAANPTAWKVFRTTDDRRWSIGDLHFLKNGVPYRLQVQYSLNFGAVTFVDLSRGFTEMDEVLNQVNETIGSGSPYYSVDLMLSGPFGLGGEGVDVLGYDRQLSTLRVKVSRDPEDVELTVSGDPIEDRSGYLRQIRGERYEFVPANLVRLYGLETLLRVYVEADGAIGYVENPLFKGPFELCRGLMINFGDDARAKVEAWSRSVSSTAYRDCELVYNYSANGNLLLSIASLSNRRVVGLTSDRADLAGAWR